MKELILYIETLLANPGDFAANRHTHEEKLGRILDHYADTRPPTVEEMIERLKDLYPSLETNFELLEKANTLRNDMVERLFSPEFDPSEVKTFEAKISLFEKVMAYNQAVNILLENVSGASVVRKGKGRSKIALEVFDTQGAAQRMLTSKDNNQNEQE